MKDFINNNFFKLTLLMIGVVVCIFGLIFTSKYEKNEQDTQSILVKNNIAVITGSIDFPNGNGSVSVPFPKGFNVNNCVVISASLDTRNKGIYETNYIIGGYMEIGTLLSDDITIRITTKEEIETNIDYGTYKIVLLKIKEVK